MSRPWLGRVERDRSVSGLSPAPTASPLEAGAAAVDVGEGDEQKKADSLVPYVTADPR